MSANLTPEEDEEGKINDLYQPVYQFERQHNCPGTVNTLRSVIIPRAEQSKFNKPRNKFLFLAYRGIADCDLSDKKFAEAEQMYRKSLEYAPVWPGLDDSAYPISLRSIGLARMGQSDWTGAEEPLQKSISIFDEQIEKAAHSESEFIRNEEAVNLRMSQDLALTYLAVVYSREERHTESLNLLDRAYQQATKYHAPQKALKQIVDSGLLISIASGDSAAMTLWSGRKQSADSQSPDQRKP